MSLYIIDDDDDACTLYTSVYQFQTVKYSSRMSELLVRGFFSFRSLFLHSYVMTLTNTQKMRNCFFSVPEIIVSPQGILFQAAVVGMTRA